MGDRTADPIEAPHGGIPENIWSAYDLKTKLGWVASGASGASAAPTYNSLGALSTSLTSLDDTLHLLSGTASGEWQGQAGDRAVAGLRQSAQNSADTAAAHARGSTSVASYGGSYDAMAAALQKRQQPAETWWTDVQDFFGVQTDYKTWVDQKDAIEREVDTALKTHEDETRTALAQFTPAAPATPVVNGSAPASAGGAGTVRKVGATGGGGSAVRSVRGAAPVPGAGAGRGAAGPGGPGDAPAAVPGVGGQEAGPSGPGTAGQGTAGQGTTATGPGGPWTAPASLATGSPTATGAAPAAGSSTYSPPIPTPTGSSTSAPYLPTLGGGGSTWSGIDGGPGPRVSTGPEFGEKLPRATGPAPFEEGVGRRSVAGSQASATEGRGYTPMMGGGTGVGGSDSTRKARYVIPSSSPFAVPMPLHPDGLVVPIDDDVW